MIYMIHSDCEVAMFWLVFDVRGGQYKCWSLEYPNSKDDGVNMGPTWVLSAPGGPHVGLMNLAIRV